MKELAVEEAIGHVLCHDMTQIIPGEFKGARFRKGHVVTEEDVPVLLSMGKRSVYVWELEEGMIHEDDAALRLCRLAEGPGCTHAEDIKEGKIELKASYDGCFTVRSEALVAVNSVTDVMLATRKGNTAVHAGDKLAGMRVIPLVIKESVLDEADAAAAAAPGEGPICEVHPFKLKRVGIVTTGSEVKAGLIEDSFTPVVQKKLAAYGMEMVAHELPGDDMDDVVAAIHRVREAGVDLVVCTGGMSVDPDDNTPGAIQKSGAEMVTYGAPVLPGAMLFVGYYEDGTPVLGLPGCVMFAGATIFDLVMPRVAAGIRLTKADIVAYGEGGLCLGCAECHYPVCPFGK
jgi:molybdopterin biosynthesis enzyme